jgi:arylsulfatase
MTRYTLIAVIVSLIGSNLAESRSTKPLAGSRPNIVLVLTDDQGMGDLSCMGNKILLTPHIDRLYKESTRFTDFQVSPTCSPTRAAMMSGRYPFEVGVSHTLMQRDRLAPSVITFPQALQKAGYQTGLFGKWHLGDGDEFLPQNRGFDEVLMHGAGGIGQYGFGDFKENSNNKYFDNVLLHNEMVVKTKGFCTDLFFQAALSWMKKQYEQEKPFFTYLSLNAPHGPLIAPDQYKRRFLDEGYDQSTAARYGMIENIDDNMGILMENLGEWKALENTLVIFMTDNGMAMKGIGHKTKGRIIAHNAGMRGTKDTNWEGGTRVPAFWYWKGVLGEGIDVSALTAHLDLYRTFCDLAGAEIPESPLVPKGRSLLPLLEKPEASWPERTVFSNRGRWGGGGRGKATRAEAKYYGASVRSDRWRLVWEMDSKGPWLSDISNDPGETENLIQTHPEVAEKLKQQYDDWWDATEPYLVNEGLPRIPAGQHHLQLLYAKQLSENGIPDWEPEPLNEKEVQHSQWNGYLRIGFEIDTRPAWLLKPKVAAKGRPWVWRARFPRYHPEVDLLLLERGFHVAYINTDGMLGSPDALKHWDAFYAYLTSEEGLSKKVALEAVSRGGLFAYRWAAQNPSSIACIYAEVPVCDFKSWPLGSGDGLGAPRTWQALLKAYQFSQAEALEYRQNPIDVLDPIAKNKVPLLHLVSLNDRVVPPRENTFVLAERYRQLGGEIEIIEVEEALRANGHHFDHPDPARVADFIEQHAVVEGSGLPSTVVPEPSGLKKFMPSRHEAKLAEAKSRNIDLVMIGDSITHNWESERDYEQTFKNANLLNLGFAGDRTENVLWRIQHGALDGIEPELVTLMIGTNHAHLRKRGYAPDAPEDVIAGIRAILTEIRTRLPESKILVFSIFPRKAGQESEVVEAVNAMLPQLADGTKIVHKDINAAFLDEEGKQRTELYHRDLLHLNSKGYESWAAALLPLLREFRLTRSENEE